MKAKKYWFKPKRFWVFCAAYYPVSPEGWASTLMTIAVLALVFILSDLNSHSASDTLIFFASWFILIATAFDILNRKTGEYPSWWKRNKLWK